MGSTIVHENNANDTLPFLDVLIQNLNQTYETEVFRKPTDASKCLNFDGQCSLKYKILAIRAYLTRSQKYVLIDTY